MADFITDYNFMMANEDSQQVHAVTPDAPGEWITVDGAQRWQGAWAISGVNSAAFPQEFAAIAALPQPQRGPAVENFYSLHFWNKFEGQLQDPIAERVLDHAVNRGATAAVLVLQRAVNSLGAKPLLAVDGRWGPLTVAGTNAADQAALLTALRAARLADYQTLVAGNPKLAQYLGTAEQPGPWRLRALR